MKQFLSLFLLLSAMPCAIAKHKTTAPKPPRRDLQKEDIKVFDFEFKNKFYSVGSGIGFYSLSDVTPFANSAQTSLKQKVVPHIALSLGWTWDTKSSFKKHNVKPLSLGVEFKYAHRKEATQTNMSNLATNGASVAFAVLKQDVQNFSITPYLQYECYKNRKTTFALVAGMPVSFKPVKKLKWHQTDGSYTGYNLKPKKFHVFFTLGSDFTYTAKKYDVIFGYRYARGHVKYQNTLFMDQPDTGAATVFQTTYATYNNDFEYSKPKGTLQSHTLSLSIIKNF
ncbi:hypothetical protein K9K77_00010 [Candidatus Babeliales bacterium]|nr:hypothetical protein [Candidatus Babeliales bacterium]